MITPCEEIGYKEIPGADHDRPVWHYRLVPGGAYLLDGAYGKAEEIEITPAMAARATPNFILRFVGYATVAEFTVDGRIVAQPIPKGPATTGRIPKEAETPKPAAPRKKFEPL
jgi:hypothetical protein